ncbi:MAG: hypothetical protein COT81_01065 [Candidatus Buchananbacteria bacterium CG10_big_fil_rev_8_21_14_0_10_42_9]|uniref:Penicillin-binding protein 2 n=1 Tax=Candidatus Buchananbacteria bacterium CG10_big_fil_rev_8_21_14_0_10_42_9 TaxID=1974526 RepID=A0A2H0W4G7_9BACT|nr:MAG: hypothetical protein COT81_01065 [Candidatus Buchananbacteria bacterium CG10_big_fil_rev_8_21_14_0_10_42_9]
MASIIGQYRYKTANLSDGRIFVLKAIFLVAMVILIAKLSFLQIVQDDYYRSLSDKRQQVLRQLQPNRGKIFVKTRLEDGAYEYFPAVTNQELFLVYAEPNKVESPNKVIDTIVPIFDLTPQEWQPLLQKIADDKDPYEPLVKQATQEEIELLQTKNLSGVGFIPQNYRYYPENSLGGHLFGFVRTIDDKAVGQYGLESYFNDELYGKEGVLVSPVDAQGSFVTAGEREKDPATNGADLYLTIDKRVQITICQIIARAVETYDAVNGSVVVMDPRTGAIIGMCSAPDYNPDVFNQVESIDIYNNPVISSPYEPGSVFKAITMAAGLDIGLVEPNSTYIDEGEVKIGPFTVRNADLKKHGQQTMTQVLEQSLNTGAIYVADLVGKKDMQRYIENFGFGKKTGIALSNELGGDISSLDKRGDIYTLTASYGQGITVTPLQLAAAFSAIANDGKLVKPYIVDEIHFGDGRIDKTAVQEISQVISKLTSIKLRGMLTSVITNGLGRKAGVEGYYLAGKTGTAQIAAPSGGYGVDTNHTFVGFGPTEDPQFTILVKLEKPTAVRYASDSATNVFREVAAFLVNHLQIPPSNG